MFLYLGNFRKRLFKFFQVQQFYWICINILIKHANAVKAKFSMATGSRPCASQWRIYYHRMWGQLSTTCCNATEIAQWEALSCSRPQPATDNGIRDGRSNWQAVTSYPTQGSTSWAPRIALFKCGLQIASPTCCSNRGTNTRPLGMAGKHTACAATQGRIKCLQNLSKIHNDSRNNFEITFMKYPNEFRERKEKENIFWKFETQILTLRSLLIKLLFI